MRSTEAEFEEIYRNHYRRVYSFLYKLCRNPETAEDLTQETFYQAYISLSRYNGQCEMFTWLAAIAKNIFFKYLRHAKNESVTIDLYISDPEAPLTDEPGYRLMRKVEVADALAVIERMPKKYSEVFMLRTYGELPYSEIAMKLGITVSSAKVIYHRAKRYIKEALIDEQHE